MKRIIGLTLLALVLIGVCLEAAQWQFHRYAARHERNREILANIEKVTAADVQRVAKMYIDPSRLAVVIVGDVKSIEGGVKGLNLGPIRPMTVDDVFGPAPQMQAR